MIDKDTPHRVARQRCSEQRQHHVRSRRRAIDAERLAEIFLLRRQAHIGRAVDPTQNAHGRVDAETFRCVSRARELALKDVVGKGDRHADIRQDVMYTVPQILLAPRTCRRPPPAGRIVVEVLVESGTWCD